MGSPRHTLSRLIHGDYFDLIPESEMVRGWNTKIEEHKKTCQHPKCLESKT